MDKKQQISKIIEKADITEETKNELLALLEKEGVQPDTIEKMQLILDDKAADIVQEITDIVAEQAIDDFNQEMDGLEKDVDAFEDELNQKADEIDLEETRKAIQE